MIALLCAALALATPSADALAPLPRAIWDQAVAAEQVGDLPMAARLYSRVLELDPAFTAAVVAWGNVLELEQQWDEAERVYRKAPSDADAVEALGRLFLAQQRYEPALATFRRLQDLDAAESEYVRLEVLALAPIDAPEAEARFRAYLQLSGVEIDSDAVAEAGMAVADALELAGMEEPALALLTELRDRQGEGPVTERYADRLDALSVRHQARELAESGAVPLSAGGRATLDTARRKLSGGAVPEARAELLDLVERFPRNPDAWAALSRAQEAAGDFAAAEQAAWMALRLAPVDASHTIRYADLLVQLYGGRRDAEAAQLYEKAALQQGGTPEVWYRRGNALLRAGDPEGAVASFDRYLAVAPEAEHARMARALIEGYRRPVPERPAAPLGSSRPAEVSVDAWQAYHEALVYQQRTSADRAADLVKAVERLDAARAEAPGFFAADNLEARIRAEQGDLLAATMAWERSLAVAPDQADVMVELATLLERRGKTERARELLERAAALGAADALLALCEEALSEGDLSAAESLLDSYFAGPGSTAGQTRATALAGELQRLRWTRRVAAGTLGSAVLVLPLALLWRRRTGATVEELIRRVPRARHEVARISSALRHEVLKHHTTVLPAVAAALAKGDATSAAWAADRLLGPAGAISRFRAYLTAFEELASRHGLRLNLRHRDPVFAPLARAMDQLERLAKQLARKPSPALAGEIDELSRVVNQDAYRALRRLIRSASAVVVDERFVGSVWDTVRREIEPGRGQELQLVLDRTTDVPLVIHAYHSELEDVLINLIRNSISAVLECNGTRVGVTLGLETDEITLVERAEIRVLDSAPRRLTTAMIRSRYIERGLGLAVDLVNKNGGSIHVEEIDRDGWTKAVVVRLPLMEES